MSHGKIQCLGSTLFLKNRFGLGYRLSLEFKQEQEGKEKQTNMNCTTKQYKAK